jgi:hypothetical protein
VQHWVILNTGEPQAHKANILRIWQQHAHVIHTLMRMGLQDGTVFDGYFSEYVL